MEEAEVEREEEEEEEDAITLVGGAREDKADTEGSGGALEAIVLSVEPLADVGEGETSEAKGFGEEEEAVGSEEATLTAFGLGFGFTFA